jgi:hypothetical protein
MAELLGDTCHESAPGGHRLTVPAQRVGNSQDSRIQGTGHLRDRPPSCELPDFSQSVLKGSTAAECDLVKNTLRMDA